MAAALYHRLTAHLPDEEALVRASGQLHGTAKAAIWGNGLPCVKAYIGPLPAGATGYTFSTNVPPTRIRSHMGRLCAFWEEDSDGIFDVTGTDDYVGIYVEVVD